MKEIYDQVSRKTSKITTHTYSTSFSLGIKLFSPKFHDPIYGVYGFVRLADEIVDSFHEFDKPVLLERFKNETFMAIDEKISLNPILNSFQWVVNNYGIERELIEKFLESMKMDLNRTEYDYSSYNNYILGSAEVVGLMCLRVFCEGNKSMFDDLKFNAMKLGAAFQKINFLRDLKNDYYTLGRSYFPNIDLTAFDEDTKLQIESDIYNDFTIGLEGIRRLPKEARFGVYLAYVYFFNLFLRIKSTSPKRILVERIRVPNHVKYTLLFKSYIKHQFNLF